MLSQLNKAQQDAITDESKRVLVIAGAGSGKTKSLLQKIEYLVKEKGVSADKILAITFTRNAANEMIDRLIIQNDSTGSYEHILERQIYGPDNLRELRNQFKTRIGWINSLTMTTFHGFCYQLLKNFGVKVYDNQFKLIIDDDSEKTDDGIPAEEKTWDVIKRAVEECAAKDPSFLIMLREYLINFHHKPEKNKKPSNPPIPADFLYTTLSGDRVRSKSEVFIADWLYRHEIDFVYEKRVNGGAKFFYPDFYIPEANIYIEHVSDLSQGTDKKKEILRFKGESLGQTVEQEMYDSSAISKKLDDILKRRLNKYISGPVLLGVKEALEPYETALKSYLGLIKRTIDFIKVTGSNPKDAVSKGTNDAHERISQFYILFERIWESYHRLCAAKSYLDFNDLMIKSNDLLSSNLSIKEALQTRFQYILVDEFQDVNIPQVNLIKSLITPNSQLFCVGDDWQSIYGFRGSVVDYIVNFDEYFPDSKKHFLNLNYRSNHSIVTTGNEVIKRNEKKIEKEIESHNKEVTEILLYLANDPDTDDVDFFVKKVNELNSAGYDQDDILVLYRRTAMAKAYRAQLKESGGQASFKTIHASKGMEAKVVFILGLNKNQGGFPDVWLNDRLFQVIREQDIKDLMEEERRLFYVAITRAKEHLFLMSVAGSESEFLIDLPKEFVKRISVQMNSASGIVQCENCGKITYGKSDFCSGCGNKISN